MNSRLFLALALGCVSQSALAIVNVENMRFGPEADGFSGHFDVSLSGKRGNTDKDEAGLDARLQHHHDKSTNFIVISYDYGEASDRRDTNKSFFHGRHVEQFQAQRAWEAFAQWEENEFARLSYRRLLGAGLRFTLLDEPDVKALHLGVGAFYSWESLEEQAGLSDHGKDDFSRGNFYLSYKHKLNAQLSIISTTYYQPRLDDADDFRALEQAALAIKMTDNLDFKISLDFAHDSRPPQLVDKTDLSYSTGISYKF